LLAFAAYPVFAQEKNSTSGPETQILIYTVKGDCEGGTETVYIEGNKTCRHYKGNLQLGMSGTLYPVETMDIEDENFLTHADLIEKTGSRMPNLKKDMVSLPKKDRDELTKQVITGIVAIIPPKSSPKNDTPSHKLKQITFFGKPCSVVETAFSKTYIWNSLILRQETSIPYKKVKEIQDIQTNVKIPSFHFEVPTDIKIENKTTSDLTSLFQNMIKNWQDTMSQKNSSKGVK
jgi:hypothetical protein